MARRTDDPQPRPSYLPVDHPKLRPYLAATQFEPDERPKQIAAYLIDTYPVDALDDSERCAQHLSGPAAAHALNTVIEQGEKAAEPHLEVADAATKKFGGANDQLEHIDRQRRDLKDEIVNGPLGRITRSQNRAQLAVNQDLAGRLDLTGDREHRRIAGAGLLGLVVAVVIAALETVVTIRIFNVSLTHFVLLSFLPWIALTVGLALFNTYVAAWLGHCRRDAREVDKSRREHNTREYSRTHYQKESGR